MDEFPHPQLSPAAPSSMGVECLPELGLAMETSPLLPESKEEDQDAGWVRKRAMDDSGLGSQGKWVEKCLVLPILSASGSFQFLCAKLHCQGTSEPKNEGFRLTGLLPLDPPGCPELQRSWVYAAASPGSGRLPPVSLAAWEYDVQGHRAEFSLSSLCKYPLQG